MTKLLTLTKVEGERIVALLPIIGGDDHEDFVEAHIVTTDEQGSFTLRRCRASGEQVFASKPFTSLPAALRAMRQSGGWG